VIRRNSLPAIQAPRAGAPPWNRARDPFKSEENASDRARKPAASLPPGPCHPKSLSGDWRAAEKRCTHTTRGRCAVRPQHSEPSGPSRRPTAQAKALSPKPQKTASSVARRHQTSAIAIKLGNPGPGSFGALIAGQPTAPLPPSAQPTPATSSAVRAWGTRRLRQRPGGGGRKPIPPRPDLQ